MPLFMTLCKPDTGGEIESQGGSAAGSAPYLSYSARVQGKQKLGHWTEKLGALDSEIGGAGLIKKLAALD